MANIDHLVQDFLLQKVTTVVGVSNQRETGANRNYKTFKQHGYRVYAVNPRISAFDGVPGYPDLKSIPEKPDAVFMLTSPKVTEAIVGQCVELGIKHAWMHCLIGIKPGLAPGSTSVSASAVEVCKDNGLTVIPGSCPAPFLEADFGHSLMRRLWSLLGDLNVNGRTQ